MSFYSIGLIQSALDTLNEIIVNEKDHLDSYILLAKIYYEIGDFVKSDENNWKAYNLNPEHPEVKRFSSIKLKKMKECLIKANDNILKNKIEMGLLWTTKALNYYPNHPKALLLRSSIYRKLNRIDEALIDLNSAAFYMNIGNNKEKVIKRICETYNEIALFLMNKDPHESHRMLKEALKLEENSLETNFNFGLCLLEKKEINLALETFQKCLRINPYFQKAKLQCAIIFYKFAIMSFNSKEYLESINYLQSALNNYSESPDFYLLRAKCYLKLHRLKKAFNDVGICLKLDPNKLEAIEIKKSFNNY